jgi:hypothetical protein
VTVRPGPGVLTHGDSDWHGQARLRVQRGSKASGFSSNGALPERATQARGPASDSEPKPPLAAGHSRLSDGGAAQVGAAIRILAAPPALSRRDSKRFGANRRLGPLGSLSLSCRHGLRWPGAGDRIEITKSASEEC